MEFLQHTILLIQQTDPIWAYLALALLVAIEGPIVTLVGAGAASTGALSPVWVFISASAGNLLADVLWYWIGYMGKLEWLERFSRRFGIQPENLEKLRQPMNKHAARVIFIAKLTMSLVIPALVSAGLLKAPWRKWFPALFLAECLWTGALVLIGYYATQAIFQVQQGLEIVLPIASVLVLVGLYLWGRQVWKSTTSESRESR